MDIGSMLGSVGGELGSGLLNTASQALLTKYNFDLSRQGIREQQEYNAPKAQMERLTQAGLNPALVYGHGANAMSPGTANPGGGGSAGMDFLGAVNRTAGTRLAEQQHVTQALQQRLLEAQIGLQSANTAKVLADTHAVKQSTDVWDDLEKAIGGKTGATVAGGFATGARDILIPILRLLQGGNK